MVDGESDTDLKENYNTSGNLGVKVHLKNGRNILFGSQKHKELAKALKQIKK